MELIDRVVIFAIGAIVGYTLGYIVRGLREIREVVDEVDDIVKDQRDKDEAGFMNNRYVADFVTTVLVIIVAVSAFRSQAVSDDVQATQVRQDQTTACVTAYLSETIDALNERTTYTQDRADSNVDLQKEQAKFLALVLERPPLPKAEIEEGLNSYFQKVTDFIIVSKQSERKVLENPYPTVDGLTACLNKKEK